MENNGKNILDSAAVCNTWQNNFQPSCVFGKRGFSLNKNRGSLLTGVLKI